jgi:hypothetical protein
MSQADAIRQVMRDKQLASLGDAYVNFVYSMAMTQIKGHPQGIKVSDKILAQAFKQAGLRSYLGTRVTKKDLANASESLLAQAYLRELITIQESVAIISKQSEDPTLGLSELLRLTAERLTSR